MWTDNPNWVNCGCSHLKTWPWLTMQSSGYVFFSYTQLLLNEVAVTPGVMYVYPFNNEIIDIPVPLVFRQYLTLWGEWILDQPFNLLWLWSIHAMKPNSEDSFLKICWKNHLRALQKLNKGEIWRRKYIVLSQMYQAYSSSTLWVDVCTYTHTQTDTCTHISTCI